MLTSESKNILESIFCLQKWNEEGSYHNEFSDSFMQELGFTDEKEKEEYSDNGEVEESALFTIDEKNNSTLSSNNSGTYKKDESTCELSIIPTIESTKTIDSTKTLKSIDSSSQQDKILMKHPESLKYDFVENHLNVGYNYDNYVSSVLKSMTIFKKLNLTKEIQCRSVNFPTPKMPKKHTLILDLDETLIHSEFNDPNNESNYLSNLESQNDKENSPGKQKSHEKPSCEKLSLKFFDEGINEEVKVSVFLRPGLREFIEEASKHFELVIFTASIKEYADAILDFLDPNKTLFNFRLYRDSCIKIGRAYIKDLRIIKNRNLENIVLLDNSLYSFANQLSNGILIYSFYDDSNDKELANMLGYLTNYLAKCDDIRFVNDQVFNFQAIFNEYS